MKRTEMNTPVTHDNVTMSVSRKATVGITVYDVPDMEQAHGSKRLFSPHRLLLQFRQDGPRDEVQLWQTTIKGWQRLKNGELSDKSEVTETIWGTGRLNDAGDIVNVTGRTFAGYPDWIDELARQYWPTEL